MTKTLEILRRQFYWPGIRPGLQSLQGVHSAKLQGQNRKKGEDGKTIPETLHLFSGQSGHAWIFIVVAHFSKYIFLMAMKEATASNVVNFLVNELFYKFGVPEKVRI